MLVPGRPEADGRAALAARAQRDALTRSAADLDRAVVDAHLVNLRPRRAVERPGRERLEHRIDRTLANARPHPREAAVEVAVVRVVGRDREAPGAALQEIVPVHRR